MASSSAAHHFAFEQTQTHKGLKNATGENNCFLNVTIQALWHLGPFRANMKQLMAALTEGQFSAQFVDQSFILALCNLFIQYEFADEQVLPPDELRLLLGSLNDKFGVGKIADANEALDTILQRIHNEFAFLCPSRCKCLAHQTFGIQIVEQYTCGLCGATSEPRISENFLLVFQSMEFLSQAAKLNQVQLTDAAAEKSSRMRSTFLPIGQMLAFATTQFQKNRGTTTTIPATASPAVTPAPLHVTIEQSSIIKRLKNRLFGLLLRQCMVSLGQQSCPSMDDPAMAGRYRCGGKALPRFNYFDPPLSLALSFGWIDTRESNDNIHSFMSLIPSNVFLEDLFPSGDTFAQEQRLPSAYRSQGNDSALLAYLSSRDQAGKFDFKELQKLVAVAPNGPSYALRGMVCYYGLHYVSIFLDAQEDNVFLLFDDQRVRPIGNWADVINLCVRSLYQPVLLIYELEDRDVTPATAAAAAAATTTRNASLTTTETASKANFIVNYSTILSEMKAEAASKSASSATSSTAATAKETAVASVAVPAIPAGAPVDLIRTTAKDTSSTVSTSSPFSPAVVSSTLAAQAKAYDTFRSGSEKLPSAITDASADSMGFKDDRIDSKSDDKATFVTNTNRSLKAEAPSLTDSNKDHSPMIAASPNTLHGSSAGISPFNTVAPSIDDTIAEIRRRHNLPSVLAAYPDLEAITASFPPKVARSAAPLNATTPPISSTVLASQQRAAAYYASPEDQTTISSPVTAATATTTTVTAPIVTTWMQKPQRYTINVPLYYIDRQQLFLGLQFMTNTSTHMLVVTAFAPHPLTQRPTWIERTGRVQLMDQVVSVNGLSGRGLTIEALAGELKKEMARVSTTTASSSASSSSSSSSSLSAKFLAIASGGGDEDAAGDEPCMVTKVRMEFESAYLQVISYRCPRCADSIALDTSLLNKMSRHFDGREDRQQYSDAGIPLTTAEPPFQFQCSNCRQMLSVMEYPTTFVTPSTSGKEAEETASIRLRK